MVLEDFLCSPPERHQNDLNDAAKVIFFLNLCHRWRFCNFCSGGWNRALHEYQHHHTSSNDTDRKPCWQIIRGIYASAWLPYISNIFHRQRRLGSADGATAYWTGREDKTESSVVQSKHSLAPTARDVCAFVPWRWDWAVESLTELHG